tara:strand:- start:1495 stop:1782 length:288 start_codon:yes stop_codon:yes gene_type:complete
MNYLQCDAQSCDHVEDATDYGPHLIGKPCPKCGESLLTQQDFDDAEPMRLMMELLIKAGIASDTGADMKHPVTLDVNQHAGQTTIKIGDKKGGAS